MARTRIGKTTLLLAGGIVTAGMLLSGPSATAAVMTHHSPVGRDVVKGANRTTSDALHGHPRVPAVSATPSAAPEVDEMEQGTTTEDLTMEQRSGWWWGGWLFLAVPAGTALAWWVSRPRDLGTTGPLYS